eukprot:TRINITY_DN29168_c0_g1_i1.p1 TRINITY_DN29168_c0_g1~~TRINITY_DN29168_c0_g1_i1.p1  ORF type:complete len:294 (+),score=77.62 TRINITY_DN29168_c0_g1_i1:238-1119(+)
MDVAGLPPPGEELRRRRVAAAQDGGADDGDAAAELTACAADAGAGASAVSGQVCGLLVALVAALLILVCTHVARYSAPAHGPTLSLHDVMSVANPHVYFDLEAAGGQDLGRVELELFPEVAPRATEHFRKLATGKLGRAASGSQRRLDYRGTKLRVITPGLLFAGGRQAISKDADASDRVDDLQGLHERARGDDRHVRGVLRFSEPWLLASADGSEVSDSNCVRDEFAFLITAVPAPMLDGRHFAFGRVARGHGALHAAATLLSDSADAEVIVARCGELGHDGQPIQELELLD